MGRAKDLAQDKLNLKRLTVPAMLHWNRWPGLPGTSDTLNSYPPIRNKNTRIAYYNAIGQFLDWCQRAGFRGLVTSQQSRFSK